MDTDVRSYHMVFSEQRKFVPKRSKRIQRKYKSGYASGAVSEDKDACWSSSNDGKMEVIFGY
jgi:chromodomain-helicase-DNA-binding protein 4